MTTTRTKTDKLDELHQRLTAQLESLISGEEWKAMLAVASRFYRYSARNVMLIRAQFPTATRLVDIASGPRLVGTCARESPVSPSWLRVSTG